jgi:chaperonin cofactor prefoldin
MNRLLERMVQLQQEKDNTSNFLEKVALQTQIDNIEDTLTELEAQYPKFDK